MTPLFSPPNRRLQAPPLDRLALLPSWAVARVLAGPTVRPEAVARGQALLGTGAWCRAGEVAHALVSCYVARRP